MDEKTYLDLIDSTLQSLCDAVEAADDDERVDAEVQHGILTFDLPAGKQLLLSRHLPSRQLWLSSPVSGGLHFTYEADLRKWSLPDGRRLETILTEELKNLADLEVML